MLREVENNFDPGAVLAVTEEVIRNHVQHAKLTDTHVRQPPEFSGSTKSQPPSNLVGAAAPVPSERPNSVRQSVHRSPAKSICNPMAVTDPSSSSEASHFLLAIAAVRHFQITLVKSDFFRPKNTVLSSVSAE